MAFESLSDKLSGVFKRLRGKGRLTEADVKASMKEVRMALLEADVNFKVVKGFVSKVEERAIGQDVMTGLNPGQMVVKIVDEELTNLMGPEPAELRLESKGTVTVIMLAGLQGAGKTTTAVKLAVKAVKRGRTPILAALDVYRPAAIEQLKVGGAKQGIPLFEMGTELKPADIASAALTYAQSHGNNVLILDTAGRLQIDDAMMEELAEIKRAVTVHDTLLVVDAMTGQEAVNVAAQFDEKAGIDGVILTKLDGDARGGAALSIKAVTGKPIYFVGMGEKPEDLEQFYPDRMANRILGMGDVLTLIDKAEQAVDIAPETGEKMAQHLKKGQLDFNDYLESMRQMKKMGGFASVLKMLPGAGGLAGMADSVDDKQIAHLEAIVLSMTPAERANPKLLNPKRKNRIARGAGLDISEVNRFIKQFEQASKMMKQMGGMKGKGLMNMMGKLR